MLSDKDACNLMEKLKKVLECMVYGTVEVYKLDYPSAIQVIIRSDALKWGYMLDGFNYASYNMMLKFFPKGFSENIKQQYSNITLKINIYKNGGEFM